MHKSAAAGAAVIRGGCATGTDIEGPGFARLIICDLASVVCALPLGTAPAGSFGVQGTHTGKHHRRAPEHGHDLPT